MITIFKVAVFAFFVACCIGRVKTDCFPTPVFEIYLVGTTLNWLESTECPDDTFYIVSIYTYPPSGSVHVFQIDEITLDVSFLPFCMSHIFTVSPATINYVGPYSQIIGSIPLPTDRTISITNFTGFQIDQDVTLKWEVAPEYRYCVGSYKLQLWNEDSADPEEITAYKNSYTINDVAQCMSYRVQIAAELDSAETPTAQFDYRVPQATNTPSLHDVKQDSVTINLTLALESYSVNRCEVTALNISGTGINTTIPIEDSSDRPLVDVNVAGLRANSMYYFNVTVVNEAGVSRPSQLAVQTLPIE